MGKKYPLEQLAFIKKKKLEEAERILREKKDKLEKEEEKLHKVEEERNKVKNHKKDKLEQLRKGLDEGIRTDKIEQMRQYLKVVVENLKQKEKKVDDQKKEVHKAEEEVDRARKNMVKKQQDVEKLKEHEKAWTREMLTEFEKEEEKESDEIASARFIRQRLKKGTKKG